jgi:hypothetical protein
LDNTFNKKSGLNHQAAEEPLGLQDSSKFSPILFDLKIVLRSGPVFMGDNFFFQRGLFEKPGQKMKCK